MNKYKPTDEIFIVSTRTGYIPQLRMQGPIPNPFRVQVQLCLSMLASGITLYEFNRDTGMTIKLTVENLFDKDKFNTFLPTEEPKMQSNDPVIPAEPVVDDEVPPVDEKTEEAPADSDSSDNEAPPVNDEIPSDDEQDATDDEQEEATVSSDVPAEDAAPVNTPSPAAPAPVNNQQNSKKKKRN